MTGSEYQLMRMGLGMLMSVFALIDYAVGGVRYARGETEKSTNAYARATFSLVMAVGLYA